MEQPGFGSSDAASMGGKARAKALTDEQRREIARLAAESRWNKKGKVSIRHAVAEAPLKVGEIEFDCAVLDDETRVLSERAFSRAIGAKRGGSHWTRRKNDPEFTGANLPVFLSANNLRPFITMELAAALSDPIPYVARNGKRGNGIKAELIPQILDVWLKAREGGVLNARQAPFAKAAEIIMRGLATTGIIALIDEATGYQDLRARDALAKILEAYIAKEWRSYIRTFPVSFFKQLCRLRGIEFREDMKLPRYFGHYINDLVWDRLAPGVKDELREKNPVQENGRRKRRHHQWLTEGIGHPKLLHHLGILEGLARGHDDGAFEAYRQQVDKALPSYTKAPLLAYLRDQKEGAN